MNKIKRRGGGKLNKSRALFVLIIGAGLFSALGAQAFSSVSTKTSPELAVALFPANGKARAKFAYERFTGNNLQTDSLPIPSQEVIASAREAIKSDPLSPNAHIILALGAPSTETREQILQAASGLNRRNLPLQTLVLSTHVEAGDFERSMATLDRILRVHPERSQEFFPVLAQALATAETIPVFANILDGSSPWHERFLIFSVNESAILPNLASLRTKVSFANRTFDQRLINGLAKQGEIEAAEEVFGVATGGEATATAEGTMDWGTDYPPFDWRLSDETGFRAQATSDNDTLELRVRPGKGGVFATRLMRSPGAPFELEIAHRIEPSSRAQDVRILLTCSEDTEPYLDRQLSDTPTSFVVEKLPEPCEYTDFSMSARAWSGGGRLGVVIEEVSFQSIPQRR